MFSGGEKNHLLGLLPVSAIPPIRFSPRSYLFIYKGYGEKTGEVRVSVENLTEMEDFSRWSFAQSEGRNSSFADGFSGAETSNLQTPSAVSRGRISSRF
jgi:hypothetical protein